MTLHKSGKPIRSVEEWRLYAPPKSADHWTRHRSAIEVARAWTLDGGANLPPEVSALLSSHPDFGLVVRWSGEPEAKLKFDAFGGETRNTDIAIVANDQHGDYLLAIEAKADEPFAETVSETLTKAVERKLANRRSNGVERVLQLAMALLGPRRTGECDIGSLRYQLLTACAGALCEAQCRGFARAVVLVHEFETPKTRTEKHKLNAQDLQNFLARLAHTQIAVVDEPFLAGPYTVPGAPLLTAPVRLYIGKIYRDLRDEA